MYKITHVQNTFYDVPTYLILICENIMICSTKQYTHVLLQVRAYYY